VTLEPLKVPLRPYQAFAVWWMLERERTTAGGGIIADEMGLQQQRNGRPEVAKHNLKLSSRKLHSGPKGYSMG
jgi:hypothetical protein